MNTIRSATAVVAVLAAGVGTLAGLTAVDSASAGTPSAAASGSFTVRAHHGTDSSVDLGKTGFSAGDQDLFTGALTRHGKHVGRVVGTCTTVRVGRSTADQLCEFVLHLGAAQITATGSVSSTQHGPGTFALPVVGGTGRYRDAHGQIAVIATNGKSFPITVSLH
jgi:D-alanyl-D-alanine carboxypeptidase